MKWFTCTPVDFHGGESFFGRDSGLLSRGFRAIGVQSKAVMVGERRSDDLDELIRTDLDNLESPDWWRRHELDGVVLYAWGRPRFRNVASAIRKAGVRLVLNQDSGGLVSPRCGLRPWLEEQWILSGAGRLPGGWGHYLARVARGFTLGLCYTDPLRARHLRQGDWIAAVSPRAAEHYRRLCASYVGGRTEDRVVCIPHPVSSDFKYGAKSGRPRVVAVGRWDDERQKRTNLLMLVVERLVARCPDVGVDIIGSSPECLKAWHGGLESTSRERVVLHGRLAQGKLVELLRGAWVSYCPSAFESFHIASAEALCCGCSVVAQSSVSMAAFEWFVSDGDGSLVESGEADAHVAALVDELRSWESGLRDSRDISSRWTARLHAPRLAEAILELAGASKALG